MRQRQPGQRLGHGGHPQRDPHVRADGRQDPHHVDSDVVQAQVLPQRTVGVVDPSEHQLLHPGHQLRAAQLAGHAGLREAGGVRRDVLRAPEVAPVVEHPQEQRHQHEGDQQAGLDRRRPPLTGGVPP